MIARVGAADPGLFALKNAIRAAIVMPLAFALSLVALDSKQMALFAGFGSMALLVFVDFGGPWRARLRAYLLLIAAGAVLISLGTLCSRSPALATAAMALVGFAILFSGALNGYVAAAQAAAMLTFVLPVMVPAGPQAIPTRLAGWGLAGLLSLAAVFLLWPARPRSKVRRGAAQAARALAEVVRVRATGGDAAEDRASAHEAVRSLRRGLTSMQHLPSGTGGRTAALARLVEDLGWLCPVAEREPAMASSERPLALRCEEIEGVAPGALEGIAMLMDAGADGSAPACAQETRAQLAQLERAHDTLGRALMERFHGSDPERDELRATAELDEAYRLRQLAYGTLQTGRDALQACGERADGVPEPNRRARIAATQRLARAHASMRSVWLRNSVRGAAGLAAAVLIGQLSDLQHAFWIVLGTMSVLRSNALATGTTIAWALLGTLAGIVVGGLLVIAAGSHEAVLWAILPVAALLAAYAPRAVSFAAGQAAFTVVVLVLFNLIEPSGWHVGLVRVEDVAIGAGVSLLAGILLWPRGATAVLREALGSAYERASGYLDATISALLGDDGEEPQRAGEEALASAQLLDATVHDFLAERSSARGSLDDLTTLIVGASRTRRVAQLLQNARSFARLTPVDDRLPRLALARDAFEAERHSRCAWYAELGAAVSRGTRPPEPEPVRAEERRAPPARVVLEGAEQDTGVPPGLALSWAHRHLALLLALEPALARAAAAIPTGSQTSPRWKLPRQERHGRGGTEPAKGPRRA